MRNGVNLILVTIRDNMDVYPINAGCQFHNFQVVYIIWGIPTWGTWWVWDARIVSTLILFIMYLGLISLHDSFSNHEKADKFLSVLVLVGSVNIPIIKIVLISILLK